MSLTRSEAAKLLALCAAYDQRTIGDADVLAWHEGLQSPWVPNIDPEEAQEAVIAHYRETTQRVNVADVLKRIKTGRADRLGRGIPVKQQGTPPSEEYRKARAEGLLEAPMTFEERQSARKPEGAA
jgi:hypothetical protein